MKWGEAEERPYTLEEGSPTSSELRITWAPGRASAARGESEFGASWVTAFSASQAGISESLLSLGIMDGAASLENCNWMASDEAELFTAPSDDCVK